MKSSYAGVVVLRTQRVDAVRVRDAWRSRCEFEQSIAPGIAPARTVRVGRAVSPISASISASGSSPPCACCSASFDSRRSPIALEQFATIGRAAAERIEAFVVPAQQCVLRGAGEGAGVDHDVVLLADAIEAADALFEQIRIERQVPQHQMMGELEIAAFRADFRTQQQARAFRIGEVGGIAVALEEAHAFVEARDLDPAARAQGFLQREHLGLAAADQQQLVAARAARSARAARAGADRPRSASSIAGGCALQRRHGIRRAGAGAAHRRVRCRRASRAAATRRGNPPTWARRLRNITRPVPWRSISASSSRAGIRRRVLS